jgi:molybdopterin converting factor small subunit
MASCEFPHERARPECRVLQITLMRILFFAQLRDITGKAQIELARDELTTNELWTELISAYPALAPFRSVVRLARNQEYVGRDAKVHRS